MDYLLSFRNDDYTIYWKFTLQPSEATILQTEAKTYNQWLDIVNDGLAPVSSYKEPADANDQYMARHRKTYEGTMKVTGDRGFYEHPYMHFSLSLIKQGDVTMTTDASDNEGENSDEDEESDDNEEAIERYRKGDLTLENNEELRELLTKPLDYYNAFTMGYRVLPFTEVLLTR